MYIVGVNRLLPKETVRLENGSLGCLTWGEGEMGANIMCLKLHYFFLQDTQPLSKSVSI